MREVAVPPSRRARRHVSPSGIRCGHHYRVHRQGNARISERNSFFSAHLHHRGMGLLLTSVARRLNGQGGDPVIQLPHLGGRQKNAGTTVRDGALGNTFECLYLPPKLSVRVQHECSTLRGVAQSGTHSTSPPSHTSGVGTGDQPPRHTARGAASGSWADNNPSLPTILRS